MDEDKINRILNLIDMIEVTDENEKDIKKVKKLIEEKKYPEMLTLLKKIGTSNTKKSEENQKVITEEQVGNIEEKKEKTTENEEENEDENEDGIDPEILAEEKEREKLEKIMESIESNENEKEIDIQYPGNLSNPKLEEAYIKLLLANPRAISMYYIENKDCYFESNQLLNIYKSVLFTEGEAYAPQVAKNDFNYAKENYETFLRKKELQEEGKRSKLNFEKTYVELRKLFEIRKAYLTNPIKETQERIRDITNYELYDKMTIQQIKDAIEQIMATEKFKRSVLSVNVTDFLTSEDNNLANGLRLPFPILSSVFKGIRKGETMAYSMPSNSGKSRFAINLAAYIAFLHKKKVLIVSNEMSEDKMKLCLITTVLNNKELQELHGQKLRKTEGEILESKYRPDDPSKVEVDEEGFVLRKKGESMQDFTQRLEKCSTEFKKVIKVTNWIQEQKDTQIYFVNITDHTNDELEKVILNYYYKEKIEYMFYDTLKPDTENIGKTEELKKTATVLANLAQNLNIFIASSLQLTEGKTSPLNLDVNDLSASRTVKEVLDTLCLIKQIHKEDLGDYEYSLKEVDTVHYDLEKSKDPDVRYYACVVDKNRAGAKPKVVFKLNLAYNDWQELGYLRLKSDTEED